MRPMSPAGSSSVSGPIGGGHGMRRGSEPLASSVVGSALSRTQSPARRPRTHTYDGSGAGGSLYAMAGNDQAEGGGDQDENEDMRSTVSFGSNVTNYSSSAHASSIGPPLPTSWSTPSSPPPLAPPHARVPPLPATLHALPPASLVSLIQSLHTHLSLTAHELDAANARGAQVQARLDTLATKAVRKITDLQRAVEDKDKEIGELRAELGEVRGRLERVVGLVASVVPRVVGGSGGGNGAGG
ncbi:hypothetical protein BCR44DRAFT_1439550 [Catenaria anguillulae PL171]|uniref:Uncharacterized protein n=1 Tax=Catenaria anguillulae PL171 TaxID=765915 RepID=A0A1Y2HDY6_9FUNG|nr:hypothetical protein BCR44DRAFT_1439550 [Catenaria anguillulae PL171]